MERVSGRRIALTLAFAAAGLLPLTQVAPAQAQESDGPAGGRARVLVAPLKTAQGVDGDFGRDVADQVRKDLRDFPTLTSIDRDEVRDELRRLKLDEKDLGLIQWRQLAGRLKADLVMFGTVDRAGSGNEVDVSFVDARTGDEMSVPAFTVPGTGKDAVRDAAGRIVKAFEGQVEYQRSLLFCQDYLSAEQYEDAIRNCDDALQRNPASSTAHYLRGRAYMGLEQWEQARADLDTVVQENPAEVNALNALAFTNAKLGNMDRAMELYREYLNFNPGDASVRLNIAFNLAQAGALDPAIALLQEGIAVDSTNADLWEYLGNVALNKGTTAASASSGDEPGAEASIADTAAVRLAVRAYDKVLELRGQDTKPEILRNVVAAHLQLGDYQQALEFADRAARQMPGDATLWSMKADIYARMDRLDDAVTAMDSALSINPDYPNGYLKRGFFELRSGSVDAAEADMRRAIQAGTDPDVVASQMLSRGYNDYFKKGDYRTAVRMFNVGTEFAQPGRVRDQLYFFTAYAYYQQGVEIDKANEASEACAPARRALDSFQNVVPALNKAGNEQPKAQSDIRDSTDVYIYRQQQIIKKACS